jgi:hypothetical protein
VSVGSGFEYPRFDISMQWRKDDALMSHSRGRCGRYVSETYRSVVVDPLSKRLVELVSGFHTARNRFGSKIQ